MKKKYLFLLVLLMMLSFSTGIFIEMVVYPSASVTLHTESFWQSLIRAATQDLFTILLAVIFAATVYLVPCMILLVLGKTFSLGFTSAYLLMLENHGLSLLLAILLPRSLLKLPAYVGLVFLSFQFAKQIKNCHQHNRSWKKTALSLLKSYLQYFVLLLLSSLIEVVLLQVVY